MNQFMPFQMGLASKPFAAHFTLPRFLPGMNQAVPLQVGPILKGTSTIGTLEGFLRRNMTAAVSGDVLVTNGAPQNSIVFLSECWRVLRHDHLHCIVVVSFT